LFYDLFSSNPRRDKHHFSQHGLHCLHIRCEESPPHKHAAAVPLQVVSTRIEFEIGGVLLDHVDIQLLDRLHVHERVVAMGVVLSLSLLLHGERFLDAFRAPLLRGGEPQHVVDLFVEFEVKHVVW